MEIHGKKIILRAVEKEDASALREMINDPYIEANVEGWSFPVSKHVQEKWIEGINQSHNAYHFAIEYKGKGEGCIGMLHIVNTDWKNRSATLGLKLINKNFRGKGIGTDALMTFMKYCFDELQLNRLDATVIEYNTASRKLLKKCGWLLEGEKKEATFKKGRYHNQLMMGITYKRYKKVINELTEAES